MAANIMQFYVRFNAVGVITMRRSEGGTPALDDYYNFFKKKIASF